MAVASSSIASAASSPAVLMQAGRKAAIDHSLRTVLIPVNVHVFVMRGWLLANSGKKKKNPTLVFKGRANV